MNKPIEERNFAMITANDVFRLTMKRPDPLVDEIITNDLIPMFKRTTEMCIKVECKKITEDYGIQQEFFVKQMMLRGFHVDVDCIDHPGGMPFYKIIIPPQEQ